VAQQDLLRDPRARYWRASLAVEMPIYQFQVVGDRDADPDVRWTHLSDADAAKKYARILIRDFKLKGHFNSHSRLELKDDTGRPVAMLRFADV
jgi:hypothetical protein